MNRKFEVIPGGRNKRNKKDKEGREISRRKVLISASGIVSAILGGKKLLEHLETPEKTEKIKSALEGIYFALTGEKRKFGFIDYDDFHLTIEEIKKKGELPPQVEALLKRVKKYFKTEKDIKLKSEVKVFDDLKKGVEFINQNQNKSTMIIVLWPARSGWPPFNTLSMGIIEKGIENGFIVWDPNNKTLTYSFSLKESQKEVKDLNIWKEFQSPIIIIEITPKININEENKKIVEEEIEKFKKQLKGINQ